MPKEHRQAFSVAAAQLLALREGWDAPLEICLALLGKKALMPNVALDVVEILDDETAADFDRSLAVAIAQVNEVIAAHNISHDEFANVQETARQALKAHLLHDGQLEYRELVRGDTEAKDNFDRLEISVNELTPEVADLRQKLRHHGGAAAIMNRLICSYLGRSEIEFYARDEGYELRRGGKPLVGWLSEGEKTAIALCYFLTTLEAEGRKKSDLIVVIVT